MNGQLYNISFGMNSLCDFSDLHTGNPGDLSEMFAKNPFRAMRDIIYCGLKNGGNVLPENFSQTMVGDWIDEMPQKDMDSIIETMSSSMGIAGGSEKKMRPAT